MRTMPVMGAICLASFLGACTITANEDSGTSTSVDTGDVNAAPSRTLSHAGPDTEMTSAEQTESTSADTAPDNLTSSNDEAASFYANEFGLEDACVQDQFATTTAEQLRSVGITADELHASHLYYLDLAIERPVFGVVLLSWSLCADFYEDLVTEDIGDLFSQEVISCFVDTTSRDPDVLMLYMLGVPTGQTFDLDSKREAVQVRYRSGLVKNEEAIIACVDEHLSS